MWGGHQSPGLWSLLGVLGESMAQLGIQGIAPKCKTKVSLQDAPVSIRTV